MVSEDMKHNFSVKNLPPGIGNINKIFENGEKLYSDLSFIKTMNIVVGAYNYHCGYPI